MKNAGKDMDVKNVNCELLSTNGNNAVTWVHPLPDGRLFTIASMDKYHCYNNTLPCDQFLFGRFSEDGGRTWGAPFHLCTWPERTPFMMCGGSMIDSRGHLHVFAMRINYIDGGRGIHDGGISYMRFDSCMGGNPIYSRMPCLERYTGSVNSCIETSSGRLVVPFSTLSGEKDSKFVSSVIYSDDWGETWAASNDISVVSDEEDIESGAVEPIVIEIERGVLLMLIRTVLGSFWYSVSRDDGKTWEKAKPTKITSSNAPGSFVRLPDGRIFLAWNDVMGHPMQGVRYSFARQCLHGAVSDDNMRTIKGARILLKKRTGDTDIVHNAYPYTACSPSGSVYLRTFEVEGMGGSRWGIEQSYLTLVDPDFLELTETKDNWDEWVKDYPAGESGIELRPAKENTAYAMTSFPYAVSGEINVDTEGMPEGGCRVILSDCYLDRLNFMPDARPKTWDDSIGSLYTSFTVNEAGRWTITWKDGIVSLSVNGREAQSAPMNSSGGLNHFGVLFTGEGSMRITGFEAKAFDNRWKTGIEY